MLAQFLLVAGAHLLAVMSPGPDFVMVTTRTLQSGKKSGYAIALGLGLGIMGHSLFALVGLAYIISQSIVIFSIIKIIGSLYLLWMSYHLLRSKKSTQKDVEIAQNSPVSSGFWKDVRTGLLTNILNPKASLFFLALFSQIIAPDTSLVLKSLYAGEMITATIVWFSLVAWMIDKQMIRRAYLSSKHWIDRTMGVVLGALGLKLLVSSHR